MTTSPSDIPEAAVEAAARAMLDKMYDDKTLRVDDEDRDIARAAIEAAAPHMLAGAKAPKHQCEPWQIQVNGSGTFRYCAACGEPQP